MGGRESKPATITYEDAIRTKRVDEEYLNRIKDAFKRISPSSNYISRQVFIKEVLGPGVPQHIAESIYVACGGTNKGIAFKDVVCGLVLLTKGNLDEKHRFLFDLYSRDGEYIFRDDFLKLVHASESGEVCSSIPNLFANTDRIGFEKFTNWLITYPELTSACRWLLVEHNNEANSHSNNYFESRNFYQTLAGVTHLEEQDIIDLEKAFSHLKVKSKTGKLDLETLNPLISPPVPKSVCTGLFNAFDENRDNHIDFKEIACGVSAACRGPLTERQKFCFKVFDLDRDGVLNEEEIKHMVEVMIFVKKEDLTPEQIETEQFDEEAIVSELLKKCGEKGGLTVEEYLIWSVNKHSLSSHFLNLIFQVCHVVLGLRPTSRIEEGEIILGWLDREVRRGFIVGQYWNLIHMDWWTTWKSSVTNDHQINGFEETLTHVDTFPILTKNNSSSSFKSFTLGRRSTHSLVGNSLALDQTDNVITKRVRPLDRGSSHYTHNRTASYHSLNAEPFSPSQSPMTSRKKSKLPGAIDNSSLIIPTLSKIPSLTGEGGKLRRNLELAKGKEFELVPAALWKVLHSWYGGGPALPRQVIHPPNAKTIQLEYYPVSLNIYRHIFQNSSITQNASWSGIIGGYGASALINVSNITQTTPKRQLTHTATLSCLATVQQVCEFAATTFHLNRQDVRLWQIFSQEKEDNVLLLEDETKTLEELGIDNENNNILVEVRNKDITWPEEINKLTTAASLKQVAASTSTPGVTGLNNLGNTCFMNAALQCVSNTRALTQYFTNRTHLYELNRTNPLGMKGHIAKRYGDLIHEIWSGTAKTIAPLKLRYTIGKYAPRFNGFQQHDSQEFLAFLLDGLHEDLNRVHDKPYVELKDSDGRPDDIVAREAWDNHIIRNKSIIVDLFHGQLKSKVTCLVCKHESVRFDPFNYLSLPLPIEHHVHIHVLVMRLDGTVPIKYGLKLTSEDKYLSVKSQLSSLTGIPIHLIRLCEIKDGQIKNTPPDDEKVKSANCVFTTDSTNNTLYAYELPLYPGPGSNCGDEERSSIGSFKSSQRDAHNFTAIQRTIKPNVCNKTQSVVPTSQMNGTVSTGVSPVEEESDDNCDSGNCSASSSSLADSTASQQQPGTTHLIAYHRKTLRQTAYFLNAHKFRPILFGLPVIVPYSDTTTHHDLYQAVWLQVARLVTPLPPVENNTLNHAMDCDDSLGYEYPFVLKAITSDGLQCSLCSWTKFCLGCKLACDDTEFNYSTTTHLAIDWDQTALHLRYQSSQEKVFEEHETCVASKREQTEPINLDYCLESFTKEEQLGENEKYYCPKCKTHQLASKKLEIYRLPPVLIVHLKRFQFINNKWMKSHKVVNFPQSNFDPTSYLASVPKTNILRHRRLSERYDEKGGESGVSSPLEEEEDVPQDLHQHRLRDGCDPFLLKYNLYGIVCHSGILGGGHYVSYACNANGKWYCYNDSSCRQVLQNEVDSSSAYMLFYERADLDVDAYMPDVSDKSLTDTKEFDEDFENDVKKNCALM